MFKSDFSLHRYTNDVKSQRIRLLISVGKGVGNDVENFSLHKNILINYKALSFSV